jgi:hypothetical protein
MEMAGIRLMGGAICGITDLTINGGTINIGQLQRGRVTI